MLSHVFHSAPEVAVFLSLGLGYLIGKIRVGSFTLGATAGTLLMGLLIGIAVPDLQVGPSVVLQQGDQLLLAGTAGGLLNAGFTVPYAIANVLLTVWGPVIVGIMH
jgi:hypothetical protein